MTHEIVLARSGKARLKVGDYVYLYDSREDLFLVNRWDQDKLRDPATCCDGPFYPLGGGRQRGESSTEAVIREVYEETNGVVRLEPSVLVPMACVDVFSDAPFSYPDAPLPMRGKRMHLYLAPGSRRALPAFENVECDGSTWRFDWVPTALVVTSNRTIDLGFWLDFCLTRGVVCFGVRLDEYPLFRAALVDYAGRPDRPRQVYGDEELGARVAACKRTVTDGEKAAIIRK